MNKITQTPCKGCARRDEMIVEISEKNDEYRREIERLTKEIKRQRLTTVGV